MKKILKYGIYVIFSSFGNLIIIQIDLIILTYFLTTRDVGIYSNAISSISILFLISTPISILFLPLFSVYKEKKKYKDMHLVMNTLYIYGTYIILPTSLIFYLYPETLIKILFGPNFVEGAFYLKIFAIFSIFKILYQYNINFMNGLGMIKKTSLILFIISMFNLIFNIIFLNLMGVLGVALITSISWLLIFISTFYFIAKETKFSLKFFLIIKIILINIIFILTVKLLQHIIPKINFFLDVSFILGISFIIYLILGYLFEIYNIKYIIDATPESFKKKILRYF